MLGFSLMKYPWYRWVRCLFGSRSFKKINKFGTDTTYVIIKGQEIGEVVEKMIADGFVEEWPVSDVRGDRRNF